MRKQIIACILLLCLVSLIGCLGRTASRDGGSSASPESTLMEKQLDADSIAVEIIDGNETTKADEEEDTGSIFGVIVPDFSIQYIPWEFCAYLEPDFAATKLAILPPGNVEIIESRDDGWVLIDTEKGHAWAYIERNFYYIDRWVSLFSDAGDESTSLQLGPQIVEIIEQDGDWIRIGTELGEKWVDIHSIRQSVLLDVPSYDQMELGYPLGCELVSLAMLMNYEHEADIGELYAEFPRADHPDQGFRGDPASSSPGWTIFPPALSGLMHKHLGSSYDMSGLEMEDLREQLNTNTPILAWVNGLGWPVHALCLTGYDKDGLFYNDPATGEKDAYITYDDFYEIWNKPIYDSVLDLTYSPRKALSYAKDVLPLETPTETPYITPADRIVRIAAAERLRNLEDLLMSKFRNFLPQSRWSIYVIDLSSGSWAESIHGESGEPTYAASLIKLFIAGAVFQADRDGRLMLESGDYADMEIMIRDSDNNSANRLTTKLGGGSISAGMLIVTEWAQSVGCPDTSMNRALLGERTVENLTTSRDCALLMSMVANGSFVDEDASSKMLEWLGAISWNANKVSKIQAGIGVTGVSIYNKTGELPSPEPVENDAAIVIAEEFGFVLCIMSQPMNPVEAKREFASIAELVFDYFIG